MFGGNEHDLLSGGAQGKKYEDMMTRGDGFAGLCLDTPLCDVLFLSRHCCAANKTGVSSRPRSFPGNFAGGKDRLCSLCFFFFFLHSRCGIFRVFILAQEKKSTPRLSYRHHVSNRGRKPSLQATAHGPNSTTPPPRSRTRAYLQTSTRSHLLGGQKTPQSIALTTCRLCKFSHVII